MTSLTVGGWGSLIVYTAPGHGGSISNESPVGVGKLWSLLLWETQQGELAYSLRSSFCHPSTCLTVMGYSKYKDLFLISPLPQAKIKNWLKLHITHNVRLFSLIPMILASLPGSRSHSQDVGLIPRLLASLLGCRSHSQDVSLIPRLLASPLGCRSHSQALDLTPRMSVPFPGSWPHSHSQALLVWERDWWLLDRQQRVQVDTKKGRM